MNSTSEVLEKMIEFDAGEPKQIQHFIKVYTFAHQIAVSENTDPATLEIIDVASILHDIGILPSREKYGDSMGKHQEELGPGYAEKLLGDIGVYSEDFIRRVCFLIGHHHTYSGVDGADYQILLEADYLVNAYEDCMPKDAIFASADKFFRTESGKKILRTMFG